MKPRHASKKLVVVMNHGPKMSRGKYAAQAIHAALLALNAHPGTPVVVIGGKASDIEGLPFKHSHGRRHMDKCGRTLHAAFGSPASL